VVGLLDEIDRLTGPAFAADGDVVLLLGSATPGLAGSEYARLAGLAPEDGAPVLDLAQEAALQRCVRAAIGRGLLASAQDVAGGGLAVALAESAIWGRRGARLRRAVASSPAVDLFGESPSRVAVSCRPADVPDLLRLAAGHGIVAEQLGLVGGDRLTIELTGAGATGAAEERGSRVADSLDLSVLEMERVWRTGLARSLGWDEAG
jgi:phosphoribosylformylglycinamidine synthase